MKNSHESILTVDLLKLENNYRFFRKKISNQVNIIAVVKAFGYGHGDIEIALQLERLGVNYFWVADFEEGVVLRKSGIKSKIIVANPGRKSHQHLLEYNLEPVIYNFHLLSVYGKQGLPCTVHIKFNTGMNRYGFEYCDIDAIIKITRSHPNLTISSICSHLAASEDPSKDDFTFSQLNKFDKICTYFSSNYNHNVQKHILNTNGVLRFSEKSYDMVRIGIGLYGLVKNPGIEQIAELKSVIAQIRKIKKNSSIGYNCSYLSNEEKTIAIIPFGYADGLNRRLGKQNGHVLIKNIKCPILGNISMDSCVIDITNVEVEEGDSVEIFGKENSVHSICKQLNTIPYEILANLSRRIKRIYLGE